jgi:hypothetical protein
VVRSVSASAAPCSARLHLQLAALFLQLPVGQLELERLVGQHAVGVGERGAAWPRRRALRSAEGDLAQRRLGQF